MKIATVVSLAALGIACGGSEPPPRATTQTTSAPAADMVARTDYDQAIRERDEARESLRQESARHERERATMQADAKSRREHDELTAKAWTSIDSAEAELKTLKEKAARGPVRDRQKIEKGIADAKVKLSKVQTDVRKIPMTVGTSWPDFKASLEASIDELDRSVREAGQ